MAIKKAKFPASSLPAIDATTGGYLIRFRVVSDDKNRKSAWSPLYSLPVDYEYSLGNAGKSVSGTLLSIAWDKAGIIYDGVVVRYVNNYDIWISYDNGTTFEYHSSTSETSKNIVLSQQGVTPIVRIYHKTNPATEIPSLLLYVI